MKVRNPAYKEHVARAFEQAAFVEDVGIELASVGPGWCETTLALASRHLQQDGVVHAGVQATMADHTAGAAAGTLVAEGERVLTLEFKLNLLRAVRAERLRCRAEVLRPGSRFCVVESEVLADAAGGEKLASKALVTLAVLEA